MAAEARGPRLVEAGLCLFAASLPLSVAGANIGWGVALAGLLTCRWEGAEVDWQAWRGPLLWPLAAYLCAALVSSLAGLDPAGALKVLNKDGHKLWMYVLLSVSLSACGPRRPVLALATGGAIAAAAGLLGWLTGSSPRAAAFVHAVTFGEQMAVLFLGGLAFVADRSRRERAAAWALSALFALTLLLCNTRGAQLAAAAGLLAGAAFLPRLRRTAAALAVIGLVGASAVDLLQGNRSVILALLGAHPHPPIKAGQGQLARLVLWPAAWRMGLDHPAFGAGIGAYRSLLPSYVPAGMLFDGGESTWGNAHNLYLHHFAERGLAGLAALGWLLWAYSARAVERARARGTVLALWSAAAAAAFLVMNVTEVALQVELVWMLALFVWVAAEKETA